MFLQKFSTLCLWNTTFGSMRARSSKAATSATANPTNTVSPSTTLSADSTIDYESFLSVRAKRLKPSAIRECIHIARTPGMISLAGGMPNPSSFPIDRMTAHLFGTNQDLFVSSAEMITAQQYSGSFGLDDFREWLKAFQVHEHQPHDHDWDICVWNGSQQAMSVAFDCLLNEGDPFLVETPTYLGALAALNQIQPDIQGLPCDSDGIIVDEFEKKLLSYDKNGEKKPRVLYTIPTGQNPSGVVTKMDRKRAIYELCCEHNLLILEDDPYWHLQYHRHSSGNKSYFHLDRESRVLRFDSFSKVVAGGFRVGFVTGPSEIVDRMQLHQQANTLHSSGLSQTILHCLLKKWGIDGFEKHIDNIVKFYESQRDLAVAAVQKHLGDQVEFHAPEAGMFLWIKCLNIDDTQKLINEGALKEKVLLIPGQSFMPNGMPSPYLRASFSNASAEELDEAFRRLAKLIHQYQIDHPSQN